MKSAVAAILVSAAASLSFDEYAVQFGKTYISPTERQMRAMIFDTNVKAIAAHNADPSNGYHKGINQFTDLTSNEFRQRFLANKKHPRVFSNEQAPEFHIQLGDLPTSLDWREKGIITPVKNQASCGSCWAFASTESVESHAALGSGKAPVILAPQQLVNCAKNSQHCGGTGGCEGSIPELAFQYVVEAGGMALESQIPYKGRDMACTYSNATMPAAVTMTGYIKLPENNYTAVMNALATIGPLAINVEADTWSSYSGGIMPASGCNQISTDIDHVVQLVGYGSEGGKDYWLVRNSWGPSWGEKGYIRLLRTADGLPCNKDSTPQDGTACEPFPAEVTVCGVCGVLYDASYPTGARIV